MTTLKEHIAFLQTLNIPYKGTLIDYLRHVFEQHYNALGKMFDANEMMPFEDFVKACLQRNPAQCPECRGVRSAPNPDKPLEVVCLSCGLSYDPRKPAPVPPMSQTNETGQKP